MHSGILKSCICLCYNALDGDYDDDDDDDNDDDDDDDNDDDDDDDDDDIDKYDDDYNDNDNDNDNDDDENDDDDDDDVCCLGDSRTGDHEVHQPEVFLVSINFNELAPKSIQSWSCDVRLSVCLSVTLRNAFFQRS